MKRMALSTKSLLVLCAFVFSSSVFATGSIQLSPLRLVMSDATVTTTLIVKNRGTSASLVQFEVFSWTQKENEDVLEPTRDILISPPVFTIAANSEQVLRAVLRRKSDPNKELSYRLYVREVEDKSQAATPGEIKVLLNISIPVFVQPTIKVQPQLKWHGSVDATKKIHISLSNSGTQHIQVKSFQLISGDKNITQNSMRYVLPDSKTEWILDAKELPLQAPITLQAVTDNGDLRETITLEKP